MRTLKNLFVFGIFFFATAAAVHADSLVVETDYRLRGISYTDLDFDLSTSTDGRSYYSQRLRISLIGKFNQGIEIGSKITSLGVVGSTSTIFPVPYPNTSFSPFIENAYVKLISLFDQPLDLTVGRQNLQYGDGLIVSDNGVGFNALRLSGKYDIPLPFTGVKQPFRGEIFTAKITEKFTPQSDQDLIGLVGTFPVKQDTWEVAYFEEQNFSGTLYSRGTKSFPTTAIVKQFYDFRYKRDEKIASYQFELAKQKGRVTSGGSTINIDALGYVAQGELVGEKTRLGRVAAHALIAYSSGEETLEPAEGAPFSSLGDDGAFSPTFTRRYDGLERAGYGQLFSATPLDNFYTYFNNSYLSYSGYNTLNLGATISPLFAWTLGVDYFLYSASQGPKGAPEASGFERLYGAEFTLGIELDLSVKYVHSKYTEVSFSYCRYTPPQFAQFWPKTDPATRYQLEISAKF